MAVNPRTASVPKREAPRHDRAAQTRQVILDAALEVFTEQTYGGARIEQIAARAGVAMGTIYKYFPGKQALANEVYRHWKRKTNDYDYPRREQMSPRQRFHEWFVKFAEFARDHPTAMEFLQTHHHAAYLDEESRTLAQPADDAAIAAIRRGQAEGAIREADPELLEVMVVGLLVALMRELIARGERIDLDTMGFAEEIAWDMMAAR